MPPYCYFNGEIIRTSDAKVGVYDIGLLRGFGIYEALATYNRKPFMLPAHMERFRSSTARMDLQIPVSDAEFEKIILDLIERNIPQGEEAAIRIILTGGAAIDGIDYDHSKSTFYVLVEPMERIAQRTFDEGCSVIVSEHLRQFPLSKTTNYIQAVLLQEERRRAGALEILYTWQGKALECATSNFFIVKGGKIITPRENILMGITRKAAMMAAGNHFPIEERDVTVDEVYAADEAFLTSSFKDVVPVVKVGDRAIGGGKPGPVTREVMRLFHELTQNA